jgi:hypothetical protein
MQFAKSKWDGQRHMDWVCHDTEEKTMRSSSGTVAQAAIGIFIRIQRGLVSFAVSLTKRKTPVVRGRWEWPSGNSHQTTLCGVNKERHE